LAKENKKGAGEKYIDQFHIIKMDAYRTPWRAS